jgi:hypothetical protein
LKHVKIRERFAELQALTAERAEITLVGLIQEFTAIQKKAERDKQHSAAVAALTAKAKLAGLWVDRTEAQNTNMNYAISDKPMTDEEWVPAFVTKN